MNELINLLITILHLISYCARREVFAAEEVSKVGHKAKDRRKSSLAFSLSKRSLFAISQDLLARLTILHQAERIGGWPIFGDNIYWRKPQSNQCHVYTLTPEIGLVQLAFSHLPKQRKLSEAKREETQKMLRLPPNKKCCSTTS